MTDDPVKKSVTVPLDTQTAFTLFTARIDTWWPKDTHSLAASDGKGAEASVHVEPRKGGKIVETLPDGQTKPWADITAYEPGARLSLNWYVGGAPDQATHVDVRFTQTEAGTRVDVTHSGFAVLGSAATATAQNYTSGWDYVLGKCFLDACAFNPA